LKKRKVKKKEWKKGEGGGPRAFDGARAGTRVTEEKKKLGKKGG